MIIPRDKRYARKKLAEDPNYQFRQGKEPNPKRWTEEALTERWEDRKARRLQQCQR